MSEPLSEQMRDWDRLNRPSDSRSYASAVAELEAERDRLRKNIDSAWRYAAYGYEIETRAEAEAAAARMGQDSLEFLMHLAWKRNPKVEPLLAENALLLKALEDTRRIVQVFAIEFEQAARIPEAKPPQ